MLRRLRPHVVMPRAGATTLGHERQVAVLGGGIAGIAAAAVLAERGARVTLYERSSRLGGRASAATEQLSTGERVEMERGFHAFFRQYYNLRALLRRIDPELSMLAPLDEYRILGPDGEREKFSRVPAIPLANLAAVSLRTRFLGLRDLPAIDREAVREMVAFDPVRTYAELDRRSAHDYLESLRFPPRARQMLFDVFAHSFFNPQEQMSAAELVMMFHFYFVANPEGIVFDVTREPMSTCIWRPFEGWLERNGVELALGVLITELERTSDARFVVHAEHGSPRAHDACVLAFDVAGTKALVERSLSLDASSFREAIASLAVAPPFVVWRLYFDRPMRRERKAFVGTTGVGALDNISVYDRFQGQSAAWAVRHEGSVVELHAYAVSPDATEPKLRRELRAGLDGLYPEARAARVVDERFVLSHDATAFAIGSASLRPTVETPWRTLVLAGDYVRLGLPSALMERAATTGMLAANRLLEAWGARAERLVTVPPRGVLAG